MDACQHRRMTGSQSQKLCQLRYFLLAAAASTCFNYYIAFTDSPDPNYPCLHIHCGNWIEHPPNIFFSSNIQGSILYPLTPRDTGALPHELKDFKLVGKKESCSGEEERVKHIIESAASSLQWKEDLHQGWEVKNIRAKAGNSHIILTRTVNGLSQTIRVDQANLSTSNSTNLQGEDPRVVLQNNGSPIVIFHDFFRMKQMWLYDHNRGQTVMLTICGHTTRGVEKNWTPFFVDDKKLLLVYSIDPLVILQYNIDSGDGVCTLIYGELPVHNMNAPYGGTPFKELSFPENENIKSKIKTRSFMSIAHSRKGSCSGICFYAQVYRPVPIVLHMFCPNDRAKENGDRVGLNGCAFGVDVYDSWHEVQSLTEISESKFALGRRPHKSVTYPYDLHVFQKSGLIRVGLEYEDCFSVYQDIKIDFDVIKNNQLHHPNRLEHENKINGNKAGLLPHVRSAALECPAAYSHGGRQVTTTPMTTNETDLVNYIDGNIWVVSHGGVSSEHFRKKIHLPAVKQGPKIIHASDAKQHRKKGNQKRRPVQGILAHYPYPIQKKNGRAPRLCIYIYGAV